MSAQPAKPPLWERLDELANDCESGSGAYCPDRPALLREAAQALRAFDGAARVLADHVFECRSDECASSLTLTTDHEGELLNEEPECPVCGSLMDLTLQ